MILILPCSYLRTASAHATHAPHLAGLHVVGVSFPVGAAAARGDGVGSTIYLHPTAGTDTISVGGDGVISIAQIDKALFGVFLIVALNAVLAGFEGEGAVGNGHTVLARQAVAGDVDLVGAAGDHQVIFGHHTVSPLRGDGDGASVHGDGVAVAGRGGTQRNVDGTLLVIADLKVPVTEQLGQVHAARGTGLRGRQVLTGCCGSG